MPTTQVNQQSMNSRLQFDKQRNDWHPHYMKTRLLQIISTKHLKILTTTAALLLCSSLLSGCLIAAAGAGVAGGVYAADHYTITHDQDSATIRKKKSTPTKKSAS